MRVGVLQVLAVVLAAGLAGSATAQTFGGLTGQVVDTTGAAITGVSVTIRNLDTNAVRSANSNESGVYALPSLVPGAYSIKVEKAGFKTTTVNRVEIQVQQTARLDFTLAIGQISESVEVVASSTLLQTENATVGTVIENRRIVELPLNGRNYLQLVSLAPNVTHRFAIGRPGRLAAGRRPRRPVHRGGRTAHHVQSLHARWRGEHRPELQHVRDSALDRRAAGIQGADGRLSGGVRPRGHADQRADQVGRQSVITARCSSSCATTNWTPRTTRSPPRVRPRIRSSGTSTASPSAARC